MFTRKSLALALAVAIPPLICLMPFMTQKAKADDPTVWMSYCGIGLYDIVVGPAAYGCAQWDTLDENSSYITFEYFDSPAQQWVSMKCDASGLTKYYIGGQSSGSEWFSVKITSQAFLQYCWAGGRVNFRTILWDTQDHAQSTATGFWQMTGPPPGP